MYRNCDHRRDLLSDLADDIFNEMDFIAFILDESGNIIHSNKFTLNFVNHSIDEIIYKNWFDIFTPDLPVEKRNKILFKCLNGVNFNNKRIKINLTSDDIRVIEFNYRVISRDNKKFIFVYGKDVTELDNVELKFRYLSDNIPGVIFVAGVYKNTYQTKYLYVNDYIKSLCGYDKEDFLSGKCNINHIIYPADVDVFNDFRKRLIENRKADVSYRIHHKDQSLRYIQETCVVIDERADMYIVEDFIYDITNVIETRKALSVSEEKFRALVENAPVGVYIIVDNKYVYVNKAFAEIHGYASPNEINNKLMLEDIVHPDHVKNVYDSINRRLHGEEQIVNYKHLSLTKDGRSIIVEIHGSKMIYNGKMAIIGTVIDVTEKVKWNDFLQTRQDMIVKLSLTNHIKNIPEIIVSSLSSFCEIDCAALYLRRNNKFFLKYDYNLDKMYYKLLKEISHDSQLSQVYYQVVYNKAPYYTRISKFPFILISKDSIKYFAFLPIFHNDKHEIVGILFLGSRIISCIDKYLENIFEIISGQLVDVLIRLKNERVIRMSLIRLKKALEDKDILIREIHHRVKNNLQVMSSLFGLQKKYVKDPEIQNLFDEIRHRIYTMSIIHEILYQFKDFSHLDLKEYLKDLVDNLLNLYSSNCNCVNFNIKMNMEKCDNFPVHYVTPIGLIINEVVSNVFKHAFIDYNKSDNKGNIEFIFDCDNSKYFEFSIIDNGVGLPSDFNVEKSSNFGIYLIKILSKSIGATFSYNSLENTRGTQFKLQLEKNNAIKKG